MVKTGLTRADTADLPLPQNTNYALSKGDLLPNLEQYIRLIRKLLYLNCTTDVCFVVHHLSQLVNRPCKQHLEGVLHKVRYLKGTLHQGLFLFAETNMHITAYSDADWAKCKFNRRSITGYYVFLGSNLISW